MLQMHLVHTIRGWSIGQAIEANHPDGLMVVSVLFEASDVTSSEMVHNVMTTVAHHREVLYERALLFVLIDDVLLPCRW